MITQQAQIKINLPLSLKELIESRASLFGIPLSGYIKHLILKEVEDMVYPTFEVSKRTEHKARKALRERNKSVIVRDVNAFFENL